jgi:hypothetical protein
LTVTINEHEAVLLLISVAVQLTVVVPFGKADPAGGVHPKPAIAQLSVTVGAKPTIAAHIFRSLGTVIFAGQVITGGCVSLTFTVNVQLGPVCDEQVTVVVPFGKKEPLGGVQLIVPQLPLVVGAG